MPKDGAHLNVCMNEFWGGRCEKSYVPLTAHLLQHLLVFSGTQLIGSYFAK